MTIVGKQSNVITTICQSLQVSYGMTSSDRFLGTPPKCYHILVSWIKMDG